MGVQKNYVKAFYMIGVRDNFQKAGKLNLYLHFSQPKISFIFLARFLEKFYFSVYSSFLLSFKLRDKENIHFPEPFLETQTPFAGNRYSNSSICHPRLEKSVDDTKKKIQ